MADENVGLDLASQTGQEDIVEAINGLKNLLSRLSNLLTLGSKTVTQNGIYNPADDGLDGYSQVDVDVNIQLYTNDTIYDSEVKIDDVSGFTKLYSTTIPYGSSGSKVSTQLSVTDENSIEALMNKGWNSGPCYDSENKIGAYAGYSFGRNAYITKCKIWLGRFSGQNKSLYATIQYLNDNDEWIDLKTLDISTTIPYPVNVFEIAIKRSIKGIRWIHKEQPQKSSSNNICFFGMTIYENTSGNDGVNVYRPTRSGLIAPPEGYGGFSNLLIDESEASNEYVYAIDFAPNSDGNKALSGGFSFVPRQKLTVSGIRFYARDTTVSVFLSDDTVVYSKENVQVSSEQWNDILFDEPITLMNNSTFTVWGSNHNTPMKYYNSGYTNSSFIKNISNKYGTTRFQEPSTSESTTLYGIDLIITHVDYQ